MSDRSNIDNSANIKETSSSHQEATNESIHKTQKES